MVTTRKRAAATEQPEIAERTPKRSKTIKSPQSLVKGRASPTSPTSEHPARSTAKRANASISRTGGRGAAYLASAGVVLASPPPSATARLAGPPRVSSKQESARKAARIVADQAAAPASLLRSAGMKRNPLLRQELPAKLTGLLDMFAALQTVHGMVRKRGQRTTFQNMRAAVEEASGRRFLLTHVAQLQHLLPESIELQWVRLTTAAHSSRTEPHLAVSLDCGAAAEAAAAEGAAAPGAAGGELQAARHLLHCRLAAHLLDDYRAHLRGRAAELRGSGDAEAAAAMEEAAAAAGDPPLARFLPPYPDAVADVPQQPLPQRPDAPSPAARAAGSPAVLGSAAAGAQAVAVTPFTSAIKPPGGTATRSGRPPVHPGTTGRQHLMHRRLSFSNVVAVTAGASCLGPAPAGKQASPLDKLTAGLDWQAGFEETLAQQQLQQERQEQQEQESALKELHPRQAALAASLSPADLQFGGRLPSEAEAAAERAAEEARLLQSMPSELRRFSTDGIISFDTLRMLEAVDSQTRRLSSKEAVEARDASAALGQLPRTFTRLQQIFGAQGPNTLKLKDVVQRIKRGGAETTSEAHIEAQLRALVQHAPEYLSLKPYGSCGTPALWVDRRANANALMQRLRGVAEGRRSMHRDSMSASLGGAL